MRLDSLGIRRKPPVLSLSSSHDLLWIWVKRSGCSSCLSGSAHPKAFYRESKGDEAKWPA